MTRKCKHGVITLFVTDDLLMGIKCAKCKVKLTRVMRGGDRLYSGQIINAHYEYIPVEE